MDRYDINRSKRRETAKLISRIAFVLFIIGIFTGFRAFNVSLVVIAIILWVLNSTIAGMLYPKRYTTTTPSITEPVKEVPKYCEACGSQLGENASFCTECGAKVMVK